MTLRASSNKPSSLFKYSLLKTGSITVLISIFMLLLCPGYLIMDMNRQAKIHSIISSRNFNFNATIPNYIIIIAVAIALSSLIYLFLNFNFLYSRSGSDFFHALPVRRSKLLLSRYFASVAPTLIPLTLSYIGILSVYFIDGARGDISLVISGYFYSILIMLAVSAFSMIFIVCAGSIFDLLVSYFTLNVGFFVVTYIISDFCDSLLKGFVADMMFLNVLKASPIIYGFFNLSGIIENDFDYCDSPIIFIIKLFAMIAVSLIFSLYLYNRRKSEKSGIGTAFGFIHIICLIIVGVIGAYLLGSIFAEGEKETTVFWVFALIGGALAAVTYGVIAEKSFKNIKKPILIGVASAVALGLTAMILWSGGLGFTARVPQKEDIKGGTVSFITTEIAFDEPDLALKLHKNILKGDIEKGNWITLEYKLKNGKSFKRGFYIYYHKNTDLLLELYKSEANIKNIEEKLNAIKSGDIRITLYSGAEYADARVSNVNISANELKKIKDAYISEMPKATDVSVESSKYDGRFITAEIYGYTNEGRYQWAELKIENSFTDTLAVLEELNLTDRKN